MSQRLAAALLWSAALTMHAVAATAQVRSDRPISVRKGGKAEAEIRVDTIRISQVDTVTLPGRVDTVTRVRYDTVRVEVQAKPIPVGGLYWGLATGLSAPASNFNDPNKTGWRLEGDLGWDPPTFPLGARLTAGYAWNPTHSWAEPAVGTAQLFNVDLNAKLRFATGLIAGRDYQLYALGGGVYNAFKDVVRFNRKTGEMKLGDVITTNGQLPTGDHGWDSLWGFNVGGGAQIGWGTTNLFTEVRYSRVGAAGWPVAYVPVVVGFAMNF